jgi:hypothetical protein
VFSIGVAGVAIVAQLGGDLGAVNSNFNFDFDPGHLGSMLGRLDFSTLSVSLPEWTSRSTLNTADLTYMTVSRC